VTLVLGACDDSDDGGEATTTAAPGATSPTSESPSSAPTTTSVPAGAPSEYADHPDDWVVPGRDYDNSRTATSDIDASNVESLEQAWTATVGGSLSTVPLIVGDTVYVQDASGTIWSLDRATGETNWQSDSTGFSIGPFGASIGDGRLYGVGGSNAVVAVDAEDGKQLWSTVITDTPSEGVDIQPLYYDGKVFASSVPVSMGGIYTGGDRGVIHALDAKTGEVLWRFDTVKGDLWGNAEVNSGGGSWYPPAIDLERGTIYWGVANPAPFPGTEEFPNGTSRPGPNLYTDSTVALDIETGKLKWYYQVHPHDLFDRDLVHSLIARTPDGPVVVALGKGGVIVGLDPAKGTPQWRTPVGTHDNDNLPELDGATTMLPGTFGGVLTPPATADGVVYAAVLNAPTTLSPDEPAYIGSELGQFDGIVVAVDAATGEIEWSTEVPGDPLGGATVVNDLVFTTLLDGEILALDRATGEIVWQDDLPGGTNGWMAVAGDLLVVPAGNADPPQLVAYSLAG
jgi:outer membrane protein assembly factor BamB